MVQHCGVLPAGNDDKQSSCDLRECHRFDVWRRRPQYSGRPGASDSEYVFEQDDHNQGVPVARFANYGEQYLQHSQFHFAGHCRELDDLWRGDGSGNHEARDGAGAVPVLREKVMDAARRKIAATACAVLLLQFGAPSFAQQAQPQPPPPPDAQAQEKPPGSSIRVTSELVLANVVVRDKKGNLIRDLKKEDFTLFEDGKKQQISTFDFENVDQLETAGGAEKTVSGEAAETAGPAGVLKKSDAPVLNARDRRVIVLYFDF